MKKPKLSASPIVKPGLATILAPAKRTLLAHPKRRTLSDVTLSDVSPTQRKIPHATSTCCRADGTRPHRARGSDFILTNPVLRVML